ncbi:hypothetical protein L596_016361 [Steinernema carpocapsae]|uniref:Uncharacterized protein n=1 Tax=Steinernema carpocapsae TaxID=34508 RepID=A0A4U5NIT6_STECR|nr:hypothetical protein L596_016361 [Steinernema carpocapsae]
MECSALDSVKAWPDRALSHSQKKVPNRVHGDVIINYPLTKVVENEWFKRLDDIKVLGVVELVYPTACHTLYTVAIGRYRIVSKFLSEHRHIPRDENRYIWTLSVCLAAMCLDLAAVPYDYAEYRTLKDKDFKKRIYKQSAQIFEEYVFPEIFQDLNAYSFNQPESILNLTKDLICSSSETQDDYVAKKFLYQLFGGYNFPITFDRLERLLVNSFFTNFGIDLNKRYVYRFLSETNSSLFDKGGEIRFAPKTPIDTVARSEKTMMRSVLNHKAVGGFQLKLFRAFELMETHKNLDYLKSSREEQFKFTDSIYRRLLDDCRVNGDRFGIGKLIQDVFEDREKWRPIRKEPLRGNISPDEIQRQIILHSEGAIKNDDFYVKVLDEIPSDIRSSDLFRANRERQADIDYTPLILIYDCSDSKGTRLKKIIEQHKLLKPVP